MKVLIVGGVAGGASAAARLRRLEESAEIVLLERGEFISFANCGLPYHIGGAIADQKDLLLQTPASFHRRFRVEVRVRHQVTAVDPAVKTVTITDIAGDRSYTETYDKLILSPGAEPVVPPVSSERVFTLRNIPDTLRIKEYLRDHAPKRAVVVGGGYIGVEMADNLRDAGVQVTLVEMAGKLLPPLDRDVAADLHHYVRSLGIHLQLGSGVEKMEDTGNGVLVHLENGREMETDLVIYSVGVRPDTGFLLDSGIQLTPKGAIVVDDRMRTSQPDIYAVGDAVQVREYLTGEPGYLPLAGPANKQGRIAADQIHGLDSRYRGSQGSAILKIGDKTVATTGLNERAAVQAGLEVEKVHLFAGSHAGYYPGGSMLAIKVVFAKADGKVLGAQVFGGEGADKRCDVLATAIRMGARAEDLAQLELCYAPPYGSAKDPVNMAGFMMQDILSGQVAQFYAEDVAGLPRDGSVTLLDVRTPREYQGGNIEGFCNIPLDDLRDRLGELGEGKAVYVHCHSGLRSYIACRILSAAGFACYNLSGGYRLYRSIQSDC